MPEGCDALQPSEELQELQQQSTVGAVTEAPRSSGEQPTNGAVENPAGE